MCWLASHRNILRRGSLCLLPTLPFITLGHLQGSLDAAQHHSPLFLRFHICPVYILSIIFLQHHLKLVTPLEPPKMRKIKTVKRGPPGNRAQLWQPGHRKSSPSFRMRGCTRQMSRMLELAPQTLWNSHLYFSLPFFFFLFFSWLLLVGFLGNSLSFYTVIFHVYLEKNINEVCITNHVKNSKN